MEMMAIELDQELEWEEYLVEGYYDHTDQETPAWRRILHSATIASRELEEQNPWQVSSWRGSRAGRYQISLNKSKEPYSIEATDLHSGKNSDFKVSFNDDDYICDSLHRLTIRIRSIS